MAENTGSRRAWELISSHNIGSSNEATAGDSTLSNEDVDNFLSTPIDARDLVDGWSAAMSPSIYPESDNPSEEPDYESSPTDNSASNGRLSNSNYQHNTYDTEEPVQDSNYEVTDSGASTAACGPNPEATAEEADTDALWGKIIYLCYASRC